MATGRFVAYYRVSTAKQGQSGLGLDGQREAVRGYLNGGDWKMVGEFTEIESGKNDNRVQLHQAMELTRLTGATLLIAKLDRLSRDAHFLIGLQKSGLRFEAIDMPGANNFTIGIMALVAQQEREAISSRTKAALAAAKARGQLLGGWRGGPKVDSKMGRDTQIAIADRFAAGIKPMVTTMRATGMTLQQVADELTAKSIMTARGGSWTASSVRAIALRAA